MDETRRSSASRICLVALNALTPGLGLIRLGLWRKGLPWLVAPGIFCLAVVLVAAVSPLATFRGAAAVMAIVLLAFLAIYVVPMVQTWRNCEDRPSSAPWWTRWYALVGIVVILALINRLPVQWAHSYYKPFYVPAEGMSPTIDKGDKFLVDMRGGRDPHIGDIVLFEAKPGVTYFKRVAALAGDSIEMRDGVPVVNGKAAWQKPVGSAWFTGYDGPQEARKLEERLPGEEGTHFILDMGYLPEVDDMPERLVSPGHIFVLGDNRDRSADSRVSKEQNGVEMVPASSIGGRPLFIHWSADRAKIGTSLLGAEG